MKAFVVTVLAIAVAMVVASQPPAFGQAAIEVGSEVEVRTGDGDCLNARWESSLTAPIKTCLPEGTWARVTQRGGGIEDTWWLLAGYGWAVERYLHVTQPPEPDLVPQASEPPPLRGLIAVIERDNNVVLQTVHGQRWRITSDGREGYLDTRYSSLSWSATGRFLAYQRLSPRPAADGEPFMETRIVVFDTFRWSSAVIEPPSGQDMWVYEWADDRFILAVEGLEKTRNVCPSPPFAHRVVAIDVVTGDRKVLASASPAGRFIGRIGSLSPDGNRITFSESGGCEGAGIACAAAIGEGTVCISEFGWRIEGWTSSTEVLLRDYPYVYPESGSYRADQIWDTSGTTLRAATREEQRAVPSRSASGGGRVEHDEVLGDYLLDGQTVLHVPAQQVVSIPRQAVAPNGEAVLFRLFRFEERQPSRSDAWMALPDGTQEAWMIAADVEEVAWQPVVPQHPLGQIFASIWQAIRASFT